MKAYLIDPLLKEVTEVEHTNGGDDGLKSIYKHTRCNCIDLVRINGEGDVIFVDDNGLLHGIPFGMFVVTGNAGSAALAGYGLVLGTDTEGDTVEPKVTLDALRAMVTFPTMAEIRARARAGEFD